MSRQTGIHWQRRVLVQDSIRQFPTPLPPINEQREIVERLDASSRLESIYQRKLAALDELKKSLLHQAFSGEL